MPQKRAGGRKKGAASGKKRTGGGKKAGRKASKPKKKATPKQTPVKQNANKKEKHTNERNKESGENGGGIEKGKIAGNFVGEFKDGISAENLKDNFQSMNPTQPGIKTVSKETNTQSQENFPLPTLPTPIKAAETKQRKRIKDPSVIASKIQIQGIAASRSLQYSALIPLESFMMNRFGATFIPPKNFQSTSGETGKMSTDESDTVSTSGDED